MQAGPPMKPPDLRPYQIEALAALWRDWRDGGDNPLVDLATGLDKSHLIADLVRRFARQGERVAVLSHVREIIEQDAKAIAALWPDARFGEAVDGGRMSR